MAKKLADLKIIDLKAICDVLNIDRQGQKSQLLQRIKDCVCVDSVSEVDCLKSEINRYKCELDNTIKTLGLLQDDLTRQIQHSTLLEQTNKQLRDELNFLRETDEHRHIDKTDITRPPPVKTYNRFLPLTDTRQPDITQRPTTTTTTTNKTRRRKVLVLGDSHSRHIGPSVTTNLTGRERVSGSVHPSGKFNDVIRDLPGLTKGYSKEDTVVLVAGANDVYCNELHNARHNLVTALDTLRHTNVLVVGVPHRHDLTSTSVVNREILKANRQFRKIVDSSRHGRFVDVSDMTRDMYTRHGLHFNDYGKDVLARKISVVLSVDSKLVKPISLSYSQDLNLFRGEGLHSS